MDGKEEKLMYHYCSNEVLFSIIKNKQLWMTDISRSNDYNEMMLFIPDIFYTIEDEYKKSPFDFQYKNLRDYEALKKLVTDGNEWIKASWEKGILTSYVVCFSEVGDVLSQWRGYANNGKGCALGFSLNEIEQYCKKYNGAIKILPVKYINRNNTNDILSREAQKMLSQITKMRDNAIKVFNMSDSNTPSIDDIFFFLFSFVIKNFIYNSLQYKWDSYSEEKEWRMFFTNITKDEEILYQDEALIPEWKKKMDIGWNALHGKIEFYIKDDCLIPYFPVDLKLLSSDFLKEIILGPKNISYIQDLQLFLAKEKIGRSRIYHSHIAYR